MIKFYQSIFLSFILIFLVQFNSSAQQYPLFSHYVLNDFAFNPAIAGTKNYVDTRIMYRNQWVGLEGNPETGIISGHGKISKKLPIGLGGYLYRDIAGKLQRTGGNMAIAYNQPIGKNTHISIGLAAGFEKIRLTRAVDEVDFNDPALLNTSNGVGIPSYSGGIYLQSGRLYVGFSIPQIFKTKIQFNEDNSSINELKRHYYGMAGYQLPINNKIAVEPSILVKYVEAAPVQFDGTLRVIFNNAFWLGGNYRTDGTLSALVGINMKQNLTLAYAYDYVTSGLNEVSNGSHEITVGLAFGKKVDSDGDGISDKEDNCPEEPGSIENAGCPDDPYIADEETEEPDDLNDPLGDTDKDGVLNKDDLCPIVVGIISNSGCPLGDRDNDGIRDDIDKCPDVFGLASNTGCPIDDRDRDGIVDNVDKCPDIPGSLAAGGCPLIDSDNDGIADSDDPCPRTPGTNGSGCPTLSKSDMNILNLAIRNLYFDTDKDEIRMEAYKYLDDLAELIVRNPSYNLRMRGYADERGSKSYNMNLSKRRVEAAFFYLSNRGVSSSQLEMRYYGEDMPSDYRPTEAGFQLNRRVEMEIFFN